MIKAITPQAKSQPRVGLTHASDVVARLLKMYGLESEMQELAEEKELAAAARVSAEFAPIAPALPVMSGTQQNTFAWFE
jgi:hypothetical protein